MENSDKSQTAPETEKGVAWWQSISPDEYFEAASFVSVQEWNEINEEICKHENSKDEK